MKSQKRVRVSHRRCVFSPHTHGKAWKQTLSSAKTLRSNTAPRNTYAELSAEIFAIFLAKTVHKKQKRQLQDAERADKALLRAEKKAMKAKRLAEVSIIADAEKEAKRLAQEEKKKEKEEKKKAELAAQTQEDTQRTKRVNQQTEPKRTKVKKEKKEEQPTSSAPKTEKKSKKEKKERQQTEEVHVKVIEPTQTPKNTPVDTPAEAPATPAEEASPRRSGRKRKSESGAESPEHKTEKTDQPSKYDLEHAAIINAAIPPKIEEVDIAQNDKKKSDKKNKKEKKAAEVVEEPVKAVKVRVAEASPAPAVEAEPVKEETQSEVSQKSEKKSRRNKKNSHRHSESQAPVDEPVVDVSDEVVVEVNQQTPELSTVSQTTPLAEAPSAEESLVEKIESPNTSGKKSRRHKKNSQRMSESSTHVDEKQTIAEPVQASETPVEVEEPVTHAEVTEDDKQQLEEVQTTDAQPEPKEPEVHPESDHDNVAETLVEAEQTEALAPAGEAQTPEDEAQTPFKAAQALVTEMQALVQEAQSHLHKKQTEMESVEVLVNEAKTLVKDAEQEDASVDASQAPTFEKVVVETLTNNDVEEESPIMQDEASADLSPETTTDHSNGKKKSRRQKRNSTRKSESQPEPVEEPIIQKVEVSAVTAENTEKSGAEPHGKHHRKGKKHGKTSESLDEITDAQAADEGITAPISEKKRHKKHSERKSESNTEEPKSVVSAVPEPSTVDNVMLEQVLKHQVPVMENLNVVDLQVDDSQSFIDHEEGHDPDEGWQVPNVDKKREKRRSERESYTEYYDDEQYNPDEETVAEDLHVLIEKQPVTSEQDATADSGIDASPKNESSENKRSKKTKKTPERTTTTTTLKTDDVETTKVTQEPHLAPRLWEVLQHEAPVLEEMRIIDTSLQDSQNLIDHNEGLAPDEGWQVPNIEKKREKRRSERESYAEYYDGDEYHPEDYDETEDTDHTLKHKPNVAAHTEDLPEMMEEPLAVKKIVKLKETTPTDKALAKSGESEAPVLEEIKVLDADLDDAQELIDHDEGQDANENWEVPSTEKRRQRRSEHKSESHPDAPSPAEEPLPETFVEETVVGESTSQPDEAWVEPPKEDHRKSKRRSGSKKFSESASDVPRQPSVEIPPVLESAITEHVTIEHAQSKKQSRKDKKKSQTNSESISDETNVVPEPSEPVELTQISTQAPLSPTNDGFEIVEVKDIEHSDAHLSIEETQSSHDYTTSGAEVTTEQPTAATDEAHKATAPTIDIWEEFASGKPVFQEDEPSETLPAEPVPESKIENAATAEEPMAAEVAPKAVAPSFDIWEEFASGKPVFKEDEPSQTLAAEPVPESKVEAAATAEEPIAAEEAPKAAAPSFDIWEEFASGKPVFKEDEPTETETAEPEPESKVEAAATDEEHIAAEEAPKAAAPSFDIWEEFASGKPVFKEDEPAETETAEPEPYTKVEAAATAEEPIAAEEAPKAAAPSFDIWEEFASGKPVFKEDEHTATETAEPEPDSKVEAAETDEEPIAAEEAPKAAAPPFDIWEEFASGKPVFKEDAPADKIGEPNSALDLSTSASSDIPEKMDVEPEKIEVSATVSKAEDGSTVIYTTDGPILSNVHYSETLDVKLVYAGTSELEGSNKKSSRRGKKNKGRHSESSVSETPAADEPMAAAPTFDIWEEFASGKPVFKDEEAEEVVEKKAVNGTSEAPPVEVEEELCQKKEFVLNQESKANEVPVAKEETKPAKAAAKVPVAPAKKEKKSRRQRKKEHTSQDSSSSPEPSHTPTPQITEEVIIPSEPVSEPQEVVIPVSDKTTQKKKQTPEDHPSTFVSAENEEPKGQTTLNEDFEIIEHSYPIDDAKEHTTVAKKGENEIEHGKKEKKSRRGKKKSHSSETGQTEITEEIVAEMSSEVKGINGTAHVSPIQVNEVTSTAAEQEGQRVLQETIKTSVEVDSSSANPTQFAQNVQKLVESTLKDKDINVNDPNVKVNVQATLVKLTEKENKPKVVYEHKPITLAFERQRTVAESEKKFERPTRERVYKLLNKDIIYCSAMIDQYGEDYEGMAKDPKNVYRDSARMIQRKMRIFRESPHFATYQKAKELGKDVAEVLEPETA